MYNHKEDEDDALSNADTVVDEDPLWLGFAVLEATNNNNNTPTIVTLIDRLNI
jgi:hypothetical protein